MVAATALLCCGITVSSWAQPTILSASDGNSGDFFGSALDLDGSLAIVGSLGDSDLSHRAGSAYIFRLIDNQWVEEQKLTPFNLDGSDNFGIEVAIDDDLAAVAAWGLVFVFRYDGTEWNEEVRLSDPLQSGTSRFGLGLDLQCNLLAIGAADYSDPSDPNSSEDSGAVFLYQFDGQEWALFQVLTASDATFGTRFGSSVSIGEGRMAIGRNMDDAPGNDLGATYIFREDGGIWTQEEMLVGSDLSGGERFGGSGLALDGNWLVVGSHLSRFGNTRQGAAYVFHLSESGWSEQQKLTWSGEQFGRGASLGGDHMAIGGSSGVVHVHRLEDSTWVHSTTILPPTGHSGNRFGHRTAISHGSLLVGGSDQSNGAGSAYLYQLASFPTHTEEAFPTAIEYEVYPNPSSGQLRVDVASAGGRLLKLEMFDQLGRKVTERVIHSDRHSQDIDVSGLSPGVYLLRIRTSGGAFSSKVLQIH